MNRPAPSMSGPATGCSNVTRACTSWRLAGLPFRPFRLNVGKRVATRAPAMNGLSETSTAAGSGRLMCVQACLTAASARFQALVRAVQEPCASRPGCFGSATGVADTHRREGRCQTPGRRETRVVGPRTRDISMTPPASRMNFKDPGEASSHAPMPRYNARRETAFDAFGTETATPTSRPSACSKPT